MKDGIAGGPVDATLPYAEIFNTVGDRYGLSPLLLFAIGWRETLCELPPEQAAVCVSGDGGHGIMQLTASFPPGWDEPATNIGYAAEVFVAPAYEYWRALEQGEALVKCVAATYNAGLGNAIAGHAAGDVDKYTVNAYGAGVVAIYRTLVATGQPA